MFTDDRMLFRLRQMEAFQSPKENMLGKQEMWHQVEFVVDKYKFQRNIDHQMYSWILN